MESTARVVDVKGNMSLFHGEVGGSTPTTTHKYRIAKCEFSDIAHIFDEFHYKGKNMGGEITLCLALTDEFGIIGGAVIGTPRHSVHGEKSLDLRRLACIDKTAPNTESYFLSKIIWYLKKNTDCRRLITFADKTVGHKGTIYKAANFKFIRETSPSKYVMWNGKRYHPRSLSIERDYSHKMREAVKIGEAKLVTGLPKILFYYDL